jgi:hypothetical protein
MFRITLTKRHAAAALVAGAVSLLAPVAQADTGFRGSPDAIDRGLAAKEASKLAAIDARERGLTERSTFGGTYGPDAFERALATHADEIESKMISMFDSRERAMVQRPLTSSPVAASEGGSLDWQDFSVGAGAGIVLMLVLLGLGAVIASNRRGHDRVTTA